MRMLAYRQKNDGRKGSRWGLGNQRWGLGQCFSPGEDEGLTRPLCGITHLLDPRWLWICDSLPATVCCDLVGTDDWNLWGHLGWNMERQFSSECRPRSLFRNYSSKTQPSVRGWTVSRTSVGKRKDHGFCWPTAPGLHLCSAMYCLNLGETLKFYKPQFPHV